MVEKWKSNWTFNIAGWTADYKTLSSKYLSIYLLNCVFYFASVQPVVQNQIWCHPCGSRLTANTTNVMFVMIVVIT